MARTRNFDPGRIRTLHYASTPGRRHAKRLVYASCVTLGLTLACQEGTLASLAVGQGAGGLASLAVGQRAGGLASLAVGQGAERPVGQRTGAVPCATCQVLSLTPDQIPLAPEALPGTRLAVRVQPGDGRWPAALQVLRQRGARAAL